MGKNEFKSLCAGNLAAHLRPGRHPCNCQARVHSLVRNCIGCGRIVCAQEGSGRCFCCGRLVCTRDERTTIERKDKEALRLLRQLLNDPNIASVDLAALSAPTTANSLAEIGKGIEAANEYKQKLLKADKDQDVTRVNDLQADYFNLEHNPYLTTTEREAIVKRKEELRQLSLSTKRNILVDLDVSTGAMQQQKQKAIETVDDPILQAILTNSAARNLHQENDADINGRKDAPNALIDTFLPKYDIKSDDAKERTMAENSGVSSHDLSLGDKSRRSPQKLFCMALKQPFACRLLSLASSGQHSICAIPWLQSVQHRGPILIAALGNDAPIESFNGGDTTEEEGNSGEISLGQSSPEKKDPNGTSWRWQSDVILAKATLVDCITWAEFGREFSELPLFRPLRAAFFLLLTDVEALTRPIPHNCSSEFFEADRSLANAVNLALVNGGGIYQETMGTL